MSPKQRKNYHCTLKIKKMSEEEIFNWTKRDSPHVQPNDSENGSKSYERNLPNEIRRSNPENKFIEQKKLQNHGRIHTKEEHILACKEFDNKFSTFEKLKDHNSTHNGERCFYCKYCDKIFSQSSLLQSKTKAID